MVRVVTSMLLSMTVTSAWMWFFTWFINFKVADLQGLIAIMFYVLWLVFGHIDIKKLPSGN